MILWLAPESRRASSEMPPIYKCTASYARTLVMMCRAIYGSNVCVVSWCGIIVNGQVDEEDVLANPVVTSTKLLVVVEVESEMTMLLYFHMEESFQRPPFHQDHFCYQGQWRRRLQRHVGGIRSRPSCWFPRGASVGAPSAAHWSRNSNLQARLMVKVRDCALWISTSRLSGGCKPAMKICTRSSVRMPAHGRRALNRSWYSTTELMRLHIISSPRGLERRGGPNQRYSNSMK
ncbi:hypothetical protein GUJ93_ZPchr0001g29266 [Zizania palustris]|uniref:Uncharacterized protein n=1 Tax=Zizania palustris TaxID=103762 RepID=A0A8J5VNS0_ZIZPA|nr:hypothetical protein GUJ93_ZPchr0001g29266 [Zizania palustris]